MILPRLVMRFVATGLVGLAIAACAPTTFQERHPIQVVQKRHSLFVTVPTNDGRMPARDRSHLESFLETYRSRGEGPIQVFVSEGAGGHAAALALGQVLNDLGVDPTAIVAKVVGGAGQPATATETAAPDTAPTPDRPAEPRRAALLEFKGYVVEVPECGDWSESLAFNPGNTNTYNFGCSVQRNIGLMVANPRDLLHTRPTDAGDGGDGQRAVIVVNARRPGGKGVTWTTPVLQDTQGE